MTLWKLGELHNSGFMKNETAGRADGLRKEAEKDKQTKKAHSCCSSACDFLILELEMC